jgi:hypothetical protein
MNVETGNDVYVQFFSFRVFMHFFHLFHFSEASLRSSAIPGGNPTGFNKECCGLARRQI